MIGEYISKDYIAMQLHAMAELISLFLSKDITIDECCKELNISDFNPLKTNLSSSPCLAAIPPLYIIPDNFNKIFVYNYIFRS